jgi:3-hydroxyacyl-[acyl-carrier-protein] dehydratase
MPKIINKRTGILESLKNTIDLQEIRTLIPHRYPMLLVDKVVDYEPKKMAAWH